MAQSFKRLHGSTQSAYVAQHVKQVFTRPERKTNLKRRLNVASGYGEDTRKNTESAVRFVVKTAFPEASAVAVPASTQLLKFVLYCTA